MCHLGLDLSGNLCHSCFFAEGVPPPGPKPAQTQKLENNKYCILRNIHLVIDVRKFNRRQTSRNYAGIAGWINPTPEDHLHWETDKSRDTSTHIYVWITDFDLRTKCQFVKQRALSFETTNNSPKYEHSNKTPKFSQKQFSWILKVQGNVSDPSWNQQSFHLYMQLLYKR